MDKKLLIKGNLLTFHIDELDNKTTREYVTKKDVVAVVAMLDCNSVVLVRQYRHAAGNFVLELPAGHIESTDESTDKFLVDAAKRELAEECQLSALRWNYLGLMHSSPGISSEKIHIWLARNLTKNNHPKEEGEDIQIIHGKCKPQLYSDAKTIAGIALAKEYMNNE